MVVKWQPLVLPPFLHRDIDKLAGAVDHGCFLHVPVHFKVCQTVLSVMAMQIFFVQPLGIRTGDGSK